jgi:hypothetical protein
VRIAGVKSHIDYDQEMIPGRQAETMADDLSCLVEWRGWLVQTRKEPP